MIEMIQYGLIGALTVVVIIIFALLMVDKKKRNEQFNGLDEKIESVNQVIIQTKDELTESFSNSINENTDTVQKKIREELSAREQIVSNLRKEINEKNNDTFSELSKTIADQFSVLKTEEDKKIGIIVEALSKLDAENKELRKKLEFFTEIESDSKNLTENEDIDTRESLIKRALEELSVTESANESGKNIEEISGRDSVADAPEKSAGLVQEPITINETITSLEEDNKGSLPIQKPSVVAPEILDEEQKQAFAIMNTTDENIFITGKAGTGKSFLLDVFVRATKKRTLKLAPTGIAALNIGGTTLHSTFGYGNLENISLEEISPATIRLKSEKQMVLKAVDTIIIDEISMVRVDLFDKIDKLLRIINKSAKPFGGKQVIVFGDLFQLPPIANKQEKKYLSDYYGGIFFFCSNAYKNGQFQFIELSTNHRQKDDQKFYEILNRMREGKINQTDIDMLNKRYISDRSKLRRVLTLFPKKIEAERLNREELMKIEAKEYVYKAKIIFNAKSNQNPVLESAFPITDELRLKRGALIMMVANDPEKRWVNGSMGIIHSLGDDFINVVIDGTKYEVKPFMFTEKEAIYEHGRIEYNDILQVEQYPIILAYAITIHKSQGMTYKNVACDISNCFAPGQSYVALSRCSSMDGLYLLDYIKESQMKVDMKILDFYLQQTKKNTIELFS